MERKLTAILSADVTGYSRLMGEDEEATIRGRIAPRGARPSTGPEKRSAPRAAQRRGGAVASRGRPPARSLRDRNRL